MGVFKKQPCRKLFVSNMSFLESRIINCSDCRSWTFPLPPPLITLDRITVRQGDRWVLQGLSWQINAGEQWAVVGSNGAGKTTLARAIAGLLPVVQGRIEYPLLGKVTPTQGIAYVASDARRELWRQERDLDFSRDFSGKINDTTSVRQLIGRGVPTRLDPQRQIEAVDRAARQLDLQPLLDKPILSVSTGEMCRVLIARQLIRQPRMLILDEPFEGLDATGRAELLAMLDQLARGGLPMVLIAHRPEELFPGISHLLTIEDGRMVSAVALDRRPRPLNTARQPRPSDARQPACHRPSPPSRNATDSVPLVEMQSVTVRYSRSVLLDRFSWTMQDGQNWAIVGANGAGKSTVLKLITGDCLQVYANRIRLFGKDRGPDQTLGEVRHQLGVVSHDLATAYQKRMTALDVVCSGFFDSVGLYRYCDNRQREVALKCLDRMGALALARSPFNQLSQGQRQMVLIARAMVKRPRLLILDEPCSGLDSDNRDRVLRRVEEIGCGSTRLIFVSHHENEIPRCTTHRLVLDQGRVISCGAVGMELNAAGKKEDGRSLR